MHHPIGELVLRDWRIEDAPTIAPHANNRKIWIIYGRLAPDAV